MKPKASRAGFRQAVVAAAMVLLLPAMARAQANCNGLVQLTGDAGPGINFAVVGTVIHVTITIGTGPISGGTHMTVTNLRFDQAAAIDVRGFFRCEP